MPRYPAAEWRPVARYQTGSLRIPISPRRLVLHTAVSNATPSMHSFFNVSGRATPHFYVGRGGEVEQYIDTDYRATALLDGNHDSITVETWDGFGTGWTGSNVPPWTDDQVEALAALAAWCNEVHAIPLVQLPSSRPGTRGVGWHRQGCDGNYEQGPGLLLGGRVDGGERWSEAGGKVCPGTNRIRQVPAIIARAAALTTPEENDDMKLSDTIGPDTDVKVGQVLRRLWRQLEAAPRHRQQVLERLDHLDAAVDALPDDTDLATVRRVVREQSHKTRQQVEATFADTTTEENP